MNWFRRCPSAEDLEQFVAASSNSGEISRHLEKCAACRDAVRVLQAEQSVLVDLRKAARDELDDARRAQIANICRDAVQNPARRET